MSGRENKVEAKGDKEVVGTGRFGFGGGADGSSVGGTDGGGGGGIQMVQGQRQTTN